jgi:hypothetical protein
MGIESSTEENLRHKQLLALFGVLRELKFRTAGKQTTSVRQIIELQEYVRARTNLEKPGELLTPVEKAWKDVFQSIDEQLGKIQEIEERPIVVSLLAFRNSKSRRKRLHHEADEEGSVHKKKNSIVGKLSALFGR